MKLSVIIGAAWYSCTYHNEYDITEIMIFVFSFWGLHVYVLLVCRHQRVKGHVGKLDINLPYVSLLTVHCMCHYFERKIDSIIVMKFGIVTYYF